MAACNDLNKPVLNKIDERVGKRANLVSPRCVAIASPNLRVFTETIDRLLNGLNEPGRDICRRIQVPECCGENLIIRLLVEAIGECVIRDRSGVLSTSA